MPKATVTLPAAARLHMSDTAAEHVGAHVPHLDLETFTTISYFGLNGDTPTSGLFVEVGADTWVENDTFTFQELFESDGQVVLYDESRETAIVVTFATDDIHVLFGGNVVTYDITDETDSAVPLIPDGWLL